MEIRKTRLEDLNQIESIYHRAREFMAVSGNATQWGKNYPATEMILKDIEQGVSYVCAEENQLYGVFVLLEGEDITYRVIENGRWKNDHPYHTIHRLAVGEPLKGIATFCLLWCIKQCDNLRVDTHRDNKVMQHVLEKNNFQKCGIIYAADGTPRIAYQRERLQ